MPAHRCRTSGIRHALTAVLAVTTACLAGAPAAAADDFPAGDEGYHTYAEMRASILAAEADHPGIVRVFSIGDSYEGRRIWAAEVSDNVGQDEGEPEVLLDGLHHGLEHMSAEQTLAAFRWLTDGYASEPRIRAIVDSRRIWFVFMVNPDGGEFDIEGGTYQDWRRNRQPTPGTDLIGTDVNRNYGFRWRCCGGASADPASIRFAGTGAFSTPEARAMRDLVESRVVGGRQRIRTHISFHTSGRLIMYPYGYTRVDIPPTITALDQRTFVAMARAMAATNGYTPQQSSDLYLSSGTFSSWIHARHRVFGFVFELTRGDRPPDERIPKETERNREAILYLLEIADCPYRAIGAERGYCGPFFDDLEIDRGWRTDPDGTDTATAGAWVRGRARASAWQLGTAISGEGVLVTERRLAVDVDGGRTTVRSPLFRLPQAGRATLRLRYWVGSDARAGAADGLTIRLVGDDGSAITTLLSVAGSGTDRLPAWRTLVAPLPAGAMGRRVAVELIARDDPTDGDAAVEAGVDSVRVTLE
jgi:hypothetical protein